MEGSIFLVNDAGKLIELKADSYNSERVLQGLLADYLNLVAGEQIDSDSPRWWLLISREVPIPDEEEGKSRWAIDHLFIDQDGVPTLIETKRNKNKHN